MSDTLVTGGSGTLGRAWIRVALAHPEGRVICYSRNEHMQAQLIDEFGHHPEFRAFLGDVRDYDRLKQACRGVETVIAAAALKRVESTAYNPTELTKTNVIGVENTIRAAAAGGVGKVVLISSDKAVCPANPYGVSKAMAETVAIMSNSWCHPAGLRVCAVRYGNVLGSRGSVIETWRKQMAKGEPFRLTDLRMTRFAMSIADAVACVRFAVRWMHGGEVFIPSLPSVHLEDVARAVNQDWPQEVVGLRSGGEKLHESLLSAEEATRTVAVDDGYYVVHPSYRDWSGEAWPAKGTRVPEGFTYTSDRNMVWLNPEQTRLMIQETETLAA